MKKIIKVLALLFIAPGILILPGCDKYKKVDGKMYYIYLPSGAGYIETEIVGYDSTSFKVLRSFFSMETLSVFEKPYAKDKNHAYFRGMTIEGADPATFKPVSRYYSIDKSTIFYMNEVRSHADPASLRVLKDDYALDSDSVYFRKYNIPEADPATFKTLGKSYACDKNNIYYDGQAGEGAENPLGFKVINNLWGKDGKAYYFFGKKVQGADYASFEILHNGKSASSSYAKDRNHVYYGFRSDSIIVVEGADPATFKLIGYSKDVGIDKNGYYYWLGEKVDKSKVKYQLER